MESLIIHEANTLKKLPDISGISTAADHSTPKREKLIFINSKKGALSSTLQGGERIGIFPPIGGG